MPPISEEGRGEGCKPGRQGQKRRWSMALFSPSKCSVPRVDSFDSGLGSFGESCSVDGQESANGLDSPDGRITDLFKRGRKNKVQLEPPVGYVSNDKDPMVKMKLSQLVKLGLPDSCLQQLQKHEANPIPMPYWNDVIQLRCVESNAGGGFIRVGEPMGNQTNESQLLNADAKGYLGHVTTHLIFHPWKNFTTTQLALLVRHGCTERPTDYCMVNLDDGTVGFQECASNGTPLPKEAQLEIECFGDGNDKTSYRYRFRFVNPASPSDELLHYLGACGEGTLGVFEEPQNAPYPNLATVFKINCPYVSAKDEEFKASLRRSEHNRTMSRQHSRS